MSEARVGDVVFCPTCKGLMRPTAGKVTCPKCNVTTEATGPKVSEKAKERETVVVDAQKDKVSLLPTADYPCEKCGNMKAYYYFRQTRSADEATTRFLECTKCAHKWRDYR